MSISSKDAASGDDISQKTESDHQMFHAKQASSDPADSSQSSSSRSPISRSVTSSSPLRGRTDCEHNGNQNHRGKVPFRKFELGKMTMSVVAPATTILVLMKVWMYSSPVAAIPLLFLCYGALSIIVGVAMSHDFPSVARLIEEVGVILVFGSFTWAMSSMFYPWLSLMVMPLLCFPILLVALAVLRYVDTNHGRHVCFGHRRCKCAVDVGDA